MAAPAISSASLRLGALHQVLLVLLCLFAFVPGIATLPPTDRDESRFVQATKQMVASGDYVDIRFQDVPRYKKPAGIYWLQSAALTLTGQGADAPIWAYRLVSVAAATIAVLATARLGAALFGTGAGLIAGTALAGIVMLLFEGRIAKTDATLLATAVIAQAALARVYLAARGRIEPSAAAPWIMWAALGASILIKGPVVPALSALTVASLLVLDRDRAWLGRLKAGRGVLLMLLIAAPWLVLITWKSGVEFWQKSIGEDFISKIGSGQESHGFPPGYYAAIYVLFLFPFAPLALRGGFKALNRMREDPALLFLVCWYVPYWVMIELIPTKLPHYALPAYPAVLLAMGWALTSASAATTELKRWQLWLWWATIVGFGLVSVALAVLSVAATPYLTGSFSIWGVVAAILLLAGAWLGSGIGPNTSFRGAILPATLASAAAFAILATVVAPGLRPIWLSPQLAATFAEVKTCPDSRLVSVGYHEPSLVFLAGTDTLLAGTREAALELANNPDCTILMIDDRSMEAFAATMPGGLDSLEELGTVEGFNYSKGTARFLRFFRMQPSDPATN
ncbi:glycosyltransferase family 39 protein [Aquibium carbonis]|uniref:Glycosyltransferase family 39 protein n=1 Tax=Aquibium carbonis TaxID=2495581 RepID=A0A429YSN1_9HYPH|nr:glycosyltransferase family 39 protein [Aquibium carbonis]RST84475.1 glycosyltransferase family 39 protein [Aquibium carbonis]